MSQIDAEKGMSGTTAERDNDDEVKLVPVSESIRYRKRAQSAEKKSEAIAQELAEVKSQAEEKSKQLDNVRVEQELTRKLAAAGSVDLEASVLIAKARMNNQPEADVDSVVNQLRNEKQYLFSDSGKGVVLKKTSGAKERITNRQTMLEKAANKAATTGNRADLQEYLKLRRNFS